MTGQSAGTWKSLAQISGSMLLRETKACFSLIQIGYHSWFIGDLGFLSCVPPFWCGGSGSFLGNEVGREGCPPGIQACSAMAAWPPAERDTPATIVAPRTDNNKECSGSLEDTGRVMRIK